MNSYDIFILTNEWRDQKGKNVILLFGLSNEIGPVQIIIDNLKTVFFVKRVDQLPAMNIQYIRKEVQLKTFSGEDVDAVYFFTNYDLRQAAEYFSKNGIATYESDIDPVKRFLMERGINSQLRIIGEPIKKNNLTVFHNPKVEPCQINPRFKILSLDIETGTKQKQLYSIACHLTFDSQEATKVFLLSDNDKNLPEYVESYSNRKRSSFKIC